MSSREAQRETNQSTLICYETAGAAVPQRTSEALLGDLIEQYQGGRSRPWYWKQVILALMICASREGRTRKLQAVSAVVIGYLTGASLCYFTTSLAGPFAGRFVGVYTTYYLSSCRFLSLAPLLAAGSCVDLSHPRAMVLWLGRILRRRECRGIRGVCPGFPSLTGCPLPPGVFVVVDFIIAPLGVLAGGLWGSSGANDALAWNCSDSSQWGQVNSTACSFGAS